MAEEDERYFSDTSVIFDFYQGDEGGDYAELKALFLLPIVNSLIVIFKIALFIESTIIITFNRCTKRIIMSDNTTNNKRIAKNTAMLYLRMIFLLGVSFYTTRAVLQVLGVVDMGIYNVVGAVVSLE
ncbi:MAG: Mth family G-protein coupled receptor [Salinivirgaceae bacterium]|nr:Mth family G-protein coupled receptor [Salinivirgaceae bacterium]